MKEKRGLPFLVCTERGGNLELTQSRYNDKSHYYNRFCDDVVMGASTEKFHYNDEFSADRGLYIEILRFHCI